MKPVLRDDRNCFGLAWFATEGEANRYAEQVRRQGLTYNGGYSHGKPCGREPAFDYDHPEYGRLYAVTD